MPLSSPTASGLSPKQIPSYNKSTRYRPKLTWFHLSWNSKLPRKSLPSTRAAAIAGSTAMPHAVPADRPAISFSPSPSPRKTVAIIGGGLAGLTAAKAAVQAGLYPTIFDRRDAVGGMWADSGALYDSLHTNVSRFTCSFSDFPWPSDSPEFPSARELGAYLADYQRAFLSLDNCRLQLRSEVLRVAPCPPPSPLPAHPDGIETVTGSDVATDIDRVAPQLPWSVEWRQVEHDTVKLAPARAAAATATAESSSNEPSPSPSPPMPLPLPTPAADGSQQQQQQQQQQRELFDFVVVASGFCASPYLPFIPGLQAFPGLVLHSAAYRGPHSLAGRRRVAVIGSGHSAVDIAADLAAAALRAASTGPVAADTPAMVNPALEVVHVTPRPFWLIPRFLPLEPSSPCSPFAPLDLVLHRWSAREAGGLGRDEVVLSTAQDNATTNAYFATLCGDQGKLLDPALAVPPDSPDPMVCSISELYGPLVTSGRLRVRRGRLRAVRGTCLELELSNEPSAAASGPAGDGGVDGAGGRLCDVDAIVMCTGMQPALPFLPEAVLEKLSYTPHDNYVPLALHRRVLHPDIPGLAFVGLFRSPFFAVTELQARLAAAAFAGGGLLPVAEVDLAAQRAGVEAELRVRHHMPKAPYPHSDYVGHADGLAAALGARPPSEWRTEHDVVIPAHYAAFPAPNPAAVTAAGSAAERATAAVQQALSDVQAAMATYRSGRRVASAVFYALAGEWILHRRIASRLASSPSGEVVGCARFTAIADSPDFAPGVGGAGGLSYLYSEQGQFAVLGGGVMRVRREYVYAYDSTADRIDVYFAEDGSRTGAFFHSLRFLPNEELQPDAAAAAAAAGTGGSIAVAGAGAPAASAPASSATPSGQIGWRAVGEHLCIRDMYNASYRFSFHGCQLRQFEIEYQVKGPNKDYTATATYSREA